MLQGKYVACRLNFRALYEVEGNLGGAVQESGISNMQGLSAVFLLLSLSAS